VSENSSSTDRKRKAIIAGIEILHQWILTLLDQGIDVLQKDEHRINDISSRLVDAGISGIARRIRTIGDKTVEFENWREYVLKELGEIYLLCRIILSNSDIDSPDIQQILGLVRRKSSIEEDQNLGIYDHWIYIGSKSSVEEKMLMFRHWFVGQESKKKALYIEYIFNKFNRPRIFELGKSYPGRIFFYPSKVPQRVTNIPNSPLLLPSDYEFQTESIPQFLDRYTNSIVEFPWLNYNVVILSNFQLQEVQNKFYLVDQKNEAIFIHLENDKIWRFKALSMDPQFKIVADYKNRILEPISYIHQSWVMKI